MTQLPYNLEVQKQTYDSAAPQTRKVSLYGWDADNLAKTRIQTKANSNTGNGELLVNLEGHQCHENSTTDQLLADGVFTGSGWQDTLDYGVLSINVASDQDSATDGLDIQWSNDGVTINDHDYFTILADTPKTFTFGPAERYYRIVYTNGSGGTTTGFHLTSILRRTYVKPSSHRISDSIVGQDDAELVKSVITGEDDNGVFQNIKSDLGGLLRVNSFPYTYAIAEGDILNHTSLLKFGTRTSVLAGTQSTIWEGPTALYTYLPTAQKLKVVSTNNTNDNAGGTGALTVTIVGLDENWLEVSEVVTMAGTTPVETANTYWRIFRAYVQTCGTSLTNTGTISVTNNAGTVTQAIINIGDGQTLMTLWTVPVGKVAYITQGTFSTNTNKGARVSLFVKSINGGILYPWQIKYRAYCFQGNYVFPFTIPFKLPAKTDVEVRVTTPGNAGTTSAGSTFETWYENV